MRKPEEQVFREIKTNFELQFMLAKTISPEKFAAMYELVEKLEPFFTEMKAKWDKEKERRISEAHGGNHD